MFQICSDRKFLIDQHAKTPSHIKKCEKTLKGPNSKGQLTMAQCLGTQKTEQQLFNQDLCDALLSSGIPISKVNNITFRSFLQKYCKFNIPDESTLRKKYVEICYDETIRKIRKIVADYSIYFIVDESTDSRGRYIAHLMIGVLHEDVKNKCYLIASKQLEKTNNLTITRFVQDELSRFFLPECIPCDKVLLMLSDNASYMVKAAQNLKIFYSNLIHVTCLAHGLNLVAEEIRRNFPHVNDLINNVKKVFIKSPVRVQLYKERLGNIPLPPLPVVTRWGTWLEAAFFYEEHFEEIKSLITELTDSTSAALEECKRLD